MPGPGAIAAGRTRADAARARARPCRELCARGFPRRAVERRGARADRALAGLAVAHRAAASGRRARARAISRRSGREQSRRADAVARARSTAPTLPAALATGALVVEDLADGASTKRALFHLLNLAREERAFVLITARSAPATWRVELPDLASRLRALPVVALAAPDDALCGGAGQAVRRPPARGRREPGRHSWRPASSARSRPRARRWRGSTAKRCGAAAGHPGAGGGTVPGALTACPIAAVMSSRPSRMTAIMRRHDIRHGRHGRTRTSHCSESRNRREPAPRAAPRRRRIASDLAASPERFINRELSWLQFNRRVLEEAENREPSAARAAALPVDLGQQPRRILHGARRRPEGPGARRASPTQSPDGLTPAEQLVAHRRGGRRASPATSRRAGASCARSSQGRTSCWSTARRLTKAERDLARGSLPAHIFPVLTPLAIDPAHPFPFIPNLGFSIALQLARTSDGKAMNALIRMPQQLERFIRLPDAGDGGAARFITLEQATGLFIARLFPGYAVKGQGAFRVIRDCDIEIEEEAEDLVRLFETRAQAPPPRLGDPARDRSGDAGGAAPLRAARARRSPTTRCSWSTACWRSNELSQLVAHRPARPEVRALQSALSRAHPRSWRRLLRRDPRRRTSSSTTPTNRSTWWCSSCARRRAIPNVVAIKQTLYRTSTDSPDRQGAGRGGRGRQVGDRAGRAEGALRRGGQHPLGARPRARRRAGGLRLHRAEDPRQAVAGGAPRGRRAASPTCTSAPATITRSPRASTPTCRSSPPIR